MASRFLCPSKDKATRLINPRAIGSGPDLWLRADGPLGSSGARTFDGAGQYVELDSAFDPGTSDFWVSWYDKTDKSATTTVLSTGAGGDGADGLRLMWNSGKLYLRLCDSVSTGMVTGYLSDAVVSNAWHHIAVCFDRDGNAVAYVDGVLQSATVDISSMPASLGHALVATVIGAYNGTTQYFNGSLARIGMGIGLLITDEIAELYNSGKGKLYGALSSSLRAKTSHYYNTNEGPGEQMYDAAGGNHGTPKLPGTNLVSNGDFETAGAGGADVFDDWTEFTSGSSTVNAEVGSGAYGGSGTSCRFDVDASNSNVYMTQDASLVSGHEYDISCYARVAIGPAYINLGLHTDASPKAITTSWSKYEVSKTDDGGRLVFVGRSSGAASETIYLDNISVVRTGPHVGAGQGPLGTDSQTGIVDGDTVTSWTDRAHGIVFSQSTAAAKPIYRASGIGRFPALEFDGDDDYLKHAVGLWASATAGLIVVVCEPDGTAASYPICTSDEASAVRFLGVRWTSFVAAYQVNNDTADLVSGSSGISAGTAYIAAVDSSGTAYSLFVNGADETESVDSGTNSGDWFGDTSVRDNVTVGARQNNSIAAYFNGKIAEILVYNEAVSEADRTALFQRLSKLYGIELAT